jgi:hypothetical protein
MKTCKKLFWIISGMYFVMGTLFLFGSLSTLYGFPPFGEFSSSFSYTVLAATVLPFCSLLHFNAFYRRVKNPILYIERVLITDSYLEREKKAMIQEHKGFFGVGSKTLTIYTLSLMFKTIFVSLATVNFLEGGPLFDGYNGWSVFLILFVMSISAYWDFDFVFHMETKQQELIEVLA